MPKLGKLKEVRERRFLSQQDLSERSGVAKSTIIRLERGEAVARFRTVKKLADALKIPPEELVDGTMSTDSIQAEN